MHVCSLVIRVGSSRAVRGSKAPWHPRMTGLRRSVGVGAGVGFSVAGVLGQVIDREIMTELTGPADVVPSSGKGSAPGNAATVLMVLARAMRPRAEDRRCFLTAMADGCWC